MDFINYQSPSEDTLEFFLNPTKASNTEPCHTHATTNNLQVYISRLELMRCKARSEGRNKDFEDLWQEYRELMWQRGDGQLKVANGAEVDYYREKKVWQLMWNECSFPGIDPSQGHHCFCSAPSRRLSSSRHHLGPESSHPIQNHWIDTQPTYKIEEQTNSNNPQRCVIETSSLHSPKVIVNISIMDSDVPQSQHKNEVILPKDLNGKEISRFLPLPQLPLRKRKFKDQEGRSFKRRKLWRQVC